MKREPVILVCERVINGKLLLPDNRVGPCAECGWVVQFRPHAPKPFIPRCRQCAQDLFDPTTDTIETTDRMLADAVKYFAGKRQ